MWASFSEQKSQIKIEQQPCDDSMTVKHLHNGMYGANVEPDRWQTDRWKEAESAVVNSKTMKHEREQSREHESDTHEPEVGNKWNQREIKNWRVCVNEIVQVFFSSPSFFPLPWGFVKLLTAVLQKKKSWVSVSRTKGLITRVTSAAFPPGSFWAAVIFGWAWLVDVDISQRGQSLSESWWQSEQFKLDKGA